MGKDTAHTQKNLGVEAEEGHFGTLWEKRCIFLFFPASSLMKLLSPQSFVYSNEYVKREKIIPKAWKHFLKIFLVDLPIFIFCFLLPLWVFFLWELEIVAGAQREVFNKDESLA